MVQKGFRDKLVNCGIDMNIPFEIVIFVKGKATYDICCFGLNTEEKLIDENYMVFYNQTQTPEGAVKYIEAHNKATFQVSLHELPEYIEKLVFTVSIDGEGTVREMSEQHFCIRQNGKELFHFMVEGSQFQEELIFVSAEIYKKKDWRVGAIASGYNFDLAGMLEYYGGEQKKSAEPEKEPESESPAVPKKAPEHCLVVVENEMVRSYPLEMRNLWLIGRSSLNIEQDIMVTSQIASRRHGCIQNISGEWYYVDMGSINGTYYNGEKIMPDANGKFSAIKLNNQDVLRIDSDDLDNPADSGVWMMFSTEGTGKCWETITLDKEETSIGREQELNDIQIPLPYVSAVHMKIIHNGREYFVMDCNSMAGTWLNGELVKGAMQLREKDKIALGECFMVFTGDKIIINTPVPVNGKNLSEKQLYSEKQHIQSDTTQQLVDNSAKDIAQNCSAEKLQQDTEKKKRKSM